MARKKKETFSEQMNTLVEAIPNMLEPGTVVHQDDIPTGHLTADIVLANLEVAQAQAVAELGPIMDKFYGHVVLALLHAVNLYALPDEEVLRSRVRRCMEIADIVVDELEKKND